MLELLFPGLSPFLVNFFLMYDPVAPPNAHINPSTINDRIKAKIIIGIGGIWNPSNDLTDLKNCSFYYSFIDHK